MYGARGILVEHLLKLGRESLRIVNAIAEHRGISQNGDANHAYEEVEA